MKTKNQKNSLKNQQKRPNNFLKYSGLAFQFMAAMLLGYWVGAWLDKVNQNEKPWFTMAFMMFFLIATLVKVIRDVSNE